MARKLSLNVGSNVQPGAYNFNVDGNSSSLNHSVNLTLNAVTDAATFDGNNFQVVADSDPIAVINMHAVATGWGKVGLRIKSSGEPASASITNIIAY